MVTFFELGGGAARVARARKVQAGRIAGAALPSKAAEKLRLTARGHTGVLKVARTIADLDGTDGVRRVHLTEVLSYRYCPAAETSRSGEGTLVR